MVSPTLAGDFPTGLSSWHNNGAEADPMPRRSLRYESRKRISAQGLLAALAEGVRRLDEREKNANASKENNLNKYGK